MKQLHKLMLLIWTEPVAFWPSAYTLSQLHYPKARESGTRVEVAPLIFAFLYYPVIAFSSADS